MYVEYISDWRVLKNLGFKSLRASITARLRVLLELSLVKLSQVIIATSKNLRSHTAFHYAVVVEMFDKGLTLLTSHMCFGRYWRSGSTSPSFGSSSKAFKSSAHRPSPKTDVESSSTRFMMFGHRVAHCDLGAFQRQDGLFLESFSVC